MKDTKQESVEMTDLINDRFYGLPMQKDWLKETYEDKKERFSKLEDFLTKQIAETENPKLMHTFLRWQQVRNELNQMYVDEISKLTSNENQINTNWELKEETIFSKSDLIQFYQFIKNECDIVNTSGYAETHVNWFINKKKTP